MGNACCSDKYTKLEEYAFNEKIKKDKINQRSRHILDLELPPGISSIIIAYIPSCLECDVGWIYQNKMPCRYFACDVCCNYYCYFPNVGNSGRKYCKSCMKFDNNKITSFLQIALGRF